VITVSGSFGRRPTTKVLSHCVKAKDSITDQSAVATTSNPIPVPKSVKYGELKTARITPTDNFGLNLTNFDINNATTLKLKRALANDFRSLVTNPDEVRDLFFVVHYRVK
jgi:hypothetical protein